MNEYLSLVAINNDFGSGLLPLNDSIVRRSFGSVDNRTTSSGPSTPEAAGHNRKPTEALEQTPFGSGSRAHPFLFSPVLSPVKGKQTSQLGSGSRSVQPFQPPEVESRKRASDESTLAPSNRAAARRRLSLESVSEPMTIANNAVAQNSVSETPGNDLFFDITDRRVASIPPVPSSSNSQPHVLAPDSDDEYTDAYTDPSDQDLRDHFANSDELESHLSHTQHCANCHEGCRCMFDDSDFPIYPPP